MTGTTYAAVCLSAILGLTLGASIPSYIHVCKRTDPDVTKCIIDTAVSLKPKLKVGIPELNVPALEPLRISDIVVSGPEHQGFNLALENVDVAGTSDFEINKLSLDVDNNVYNIDVSFPLLRLSGDCDVDAKIVNLNIKGRGKFDAEATKCTATAVLKGETYERDGKRYMRFVDLKLDLTVGNYELKVADLLEDETLNETINELITQNKDELMNLATPYIQEKASEVILQLTNNIVKDFPYDEVFPA